MQHPPLRSGCRTADHHVVHDKMKADDQLIEAAQYGDLDLAQQAVQAGANANATFRGATALWWACQEGHLEIVKLLISRGADVNTGDEECGHTPLRQAVGEDHPEIAELMIRNGADPNSGTPSDPGDTPLLIACAYGRVDCAKALLSLGADPKLRAAEGHTPADHAKLNGYQELADMLECWDAQQ